VTAAGQRKERIMRKLPIILIASAVLAGCGHTPEDQPSRGLAAVNVPVVARSDFAFDVSAPDGSLSPGEAERLDTWFRSLGLGYGDTVYVDGGDGPARGQIASIAGRYGLLLGSGAPLTAGAIPPGAVRVVVSRTRVSVPGCPNWSDAAQPNFQNRTMSNFGCAVNANLAAMVANPVDLIHGREGNAYSDAATGAKAIDLYRGWPLTAVTEGQGKRPLKSENTKKGDE
jgi:pilus assembly protein CpaD